MVWTFAQAIAEQAERFGAYLGIVAFFGLALLAILYFAQARELKRLRDWAGRAPERARELEERAMTQPQPAADQGAAVPGAAPVPVAEAAAASATATTATPESPAAEPASAPDSAVTSIQPAASASAEAPAAAPGATNGADPGRPAPAAEPAEDENEGSEEQPPAEPEAAPPGRDPEPETPQPEPVGAVPAVAAGGNGSGNGKAGAVDPPAPEAGAPAAAGTGAAAEAALPASARATRPGASPRPATAAALRSTRPSATPPRRPAPPPRPVSAPGPRRRVPTGSTALIAIVAFLLLGGGALAITTLGGDDAPESDGAGVTAEATPTPEAEATPDVTGLRDETTVAVLNGTTINGLAAEVAQQLTRVGYVEGPRGNYTPDQQRASSVVYYREGFDDRARDVGEVLGISEVQAIDSQTRTQSIGDAQVVVVTGHDQAP